MEKKVVCISLDPGKVNFAYCCGSILFEEEENICLTLDNTGLIHNTIVNLDKIHGMPSCKAFFLEITTLFDKVKPNIVIFERMQQRPGKGCGSTVEFINIMLGIIMLYCLQNDIRWYGITASTWKNYMHRVYDVCHDNSGKFIRKNILHSARMGFSVKKESKTSPIKDHEFDACGILQYYLECGLNKKFFNEFSSFLTTEWESRKKDTPKIVQSSKSKNSKSKKRKINNEY